MIESPPDSTETELPPSHLQPDERLLGRYRDGEESAATSLYLRYANRLRALAQKYCTNRFAGRFDADDVVQSVFRTFFEGVRREAYDVPPQGEIWGLLMVLALNKVRNLVGHHSAGKRDVHRTTGSDIDRQHDLGRDESAAALLRVVVEEQIGELPESNRTIIEMRLEGYEVREIAERVGRSRRTVERVLQDFRTRLLKA